MKEAMAIILCVFCLTGCGKRGKLDFPPGTTYPLQYPSARQPVSEQIKAISPQSNVEKPFESGEEVDILTKTEE
jgi:predicted small lipoprotein YifL